VIELWGLSGSGNCYKPLLTCELLDLPYRWNEVEFTAHYLRSPQFLALNPNGKVPAARLEDGTALFESNAIMHYLADGSPLLPSGRLARAQVMQWLFFEQYSHEPYVATARFLLTLKLAQATDPDAVRRQAADKLAGGHKALGIMEQHLRDHPYFVGSGLTIADIALYAYTHVAEEGDFALQDYPAIRAWLQRVAAQPGFVPMPAFVVPNQG
jgi:glutathione S-transferase